MNWLKKILIVSLLPYILFALVNCGVKGDPLPPEKPTDLGRGRPTYKRATKDIPLQKAPPEEKSDEEDDEDDEKEEREHE